MPKSNDIQDIQDTDDQAEPANLPEGRRFTYRSVVVVVLMLVIITGGVGAYLDQGSIPLKAAYGFGLALILGSIYLVAGEKIPNWIHKATESRGTLLTRPDDERNVPLPVVLGCIGGAILIALALFGLWYLGVIF